MPTNFTYDKVRSNTEKLLIKGQFYKADVFIARIDGRRFIVKDYAQKGFWERNLVGRTIIGREARAYAALAGVDGMPAQFKRVSPFSFVVEYLEGKDLGSVERQEVGIDVIRQLERIVHDLHKRGWVHLDLHRRSNILLVNGKVFVVDLASALHPGGIPVLGRCLIGLIGFADRLSLIKMKAIFAPESLTAQERKWLGIRNMVMPSKWHQSP